MKEKRYMKTCSLVLFFIFSLCAYSQQLYSPSGDHFAKTKRDIYDTAKYCAYYELHFLEDSTKRTDYTECQTVLMISDSYTLFGDYNRIVFDSINDFLAESRKNAKDKAARALWNASINRWKYNVVTMNDLATLRSKIQIYDVLRSYDYSFDTPDFAWKLEKGDSVINQVHCQKASCSYAGRDYVAWYAESIPLPYGPYIFGGLPGLIMKLHDTKMNWIFTNTGVEKPKRHAAMYLYHDRFIQPIIATTREKALEAYRNDVENYDNLSIGIFNVKVLKDGKWVSPETNRPKRPSNLLELKW